MCIDIHGTIVDRSERSNFNGVATRETFVKRQDVVNVQRKVRDFSNHHHYDDAVSVDRMVAQLRAEDYDPVLVYKAQNVSGSDSLTMGLPVATFLLAIMTECQKALLSAFGGKLVCLDSTHKTTQYGFKLISLVVADEFHNGKCICIHMR